MQTQQSSLTLFKTCLVAWLMLLSVLMTPAAVYAQPEASASPEWHYTMRPADSLQSVANKLLARGHSWSDLVRFNQIDDITKVQPGAILRIPVDWLKFQPKPANTLSTSGSVLVKKVRDSRFRVLKAGMTIHVGDEIATRQGTALIQFADGSLLRLEPDSNLVFNKLSHYGATGMVDTRMRLKKGALSTEVNPLVKGSRFEITTPSAVAAVRGTKFRLKTDANSSTLEVTEGSVEFSHEHGAQLISAGEGARIQAQRPQIERVPLPPAPTPQFAGEVKDLPTVLAWDSPEAAEFRYQLLDENGQERLQTQVSNAPQAALENVANGAYQVSMRAIDDQGFEGPDATTPINVVLNADVAELLAPVDATLTNSARPEFRWQLAEDDTVSRLEIARDADFNTLVDNPEFVQTDRAQPVRDLAPGTYFWRIASVSGGNQTAYSATRTLSVRGQLPLVKILSVNYLGNQVGLFWTKLDAAQGYRLQVSDSSQFDTILKEETIGKTSAHLKLTPGKRYFARVKGMPSELYQSDYGPVKELYIPE